MNAEETHMVNTFVEKHNQLVIDYSILRTELDTERSNNEILQTELRNCYQELSYLKNPKEPVPVILPRLNVSPVLETPKKISKKVATKPKKKSV